MKAGTSWWYRVLVEQPGIVAVPDRPKETHFFDRFHDSVQPPPTPEDYAAYFPRPPGAIVGEWTPRYLHDFLVPRLLRSVAPMARLLVMLRDPLERFRSGLAHDLSRGVPLTSALTQEHFERGLYHAQLVRLLRWFPPDQILMLQYERCRSDPEGELRRCLEFLGLDAEPRLDPLAKEVNVTSAAKPELPAHTEDALRAGYAEDAAALAEAFPEIDLDLWASVATRRA
jgi:hypothetical protein